MHLKLPFPCVLHLIAETVNQALLVAPSLIFNKVEITTELTLK